VVEAVVPLKLKGRRRLESPVLALRLAALLVLLVLNALVPGYLLVRRRGFRPVETLAASIGASLLVLYLATFALYLSGAPMTLSAAGSLVVAGLAFAGRKDLGRLVASPGVRRAGQGFVLLFAWCVAFMAIVRHFGGGGWGQDWLEQFHRCLYFLDRLPADVMLSGKAHLTARPPLMNLVAAYFLAQAGDDFECFQLVYAFLNALPFFACALLAGRLLEGGGRGVGVLAALLALCPLFVANVTYTWTKLLCAFYVLLAVHFYLAAHRTRDPWRMVAWPLALAGALLVHYSAGVFAIFIAGHFLVHLVREEPPRLWGRRLWPVLPGVVVLATWIVFALASFGLARTATSNSSVGDSRDYSTAGNVLKVVLNVVDTVVPHPLRGVLPLPLSGERLLGDLRDYFFLIYQTNVLAAVGSVGGLVAVGLAVRRLRRTPTWETRFWWGFIPFVLVAGVATHGGRDLFGVAHVTSQPLVLLGVALLAAGWRRLSRAARWAVLAGCVLDFGLAIALHHHVESLENRPARQVFDPDIRVTAEGFEWRREGTLPSSDWQGWYAKQSRRLLQAQLTRAEALPPDRAQRVVDAVAPELARQERVDADEWGGWWRRHDGRLTFVGDRLAGAAPAVWLGIGVLLVSFLARLGRSRRDGAGHAFEYNARSS
jgi:hypothetical protein